MRKKWLSAALSLTMAVTPLAGANVMQVAAEEEPYEVVMAYADSVPEDLQRIEDAINEIAIKEINMKVKLMPMSWGDYGDTINLMLSSGEHLDIFNILGGAASFVDRGQIVDLRPLLDEYGTNIKAVLGEDVAYSSQVNGIVYGVLTNRDQAMDMSIVMRKDLCDKYGITADMVHTQEDIGNVLEIIHENEPNMIALASFANSTPLMKISDVDYMDDWFGVLLNNGADTTEVVNWFDTDEFEHDIRLLREWNQKGYFAADAATVQDSMETQMKAGNVFAYLSNTKPGFDIQTKSQTGYDVICAPFTGVFTYSSYTGGFNYGIAANSKDPAKAMQFLDWAYGSADFNNLVIYGQEGIDYKFVDGSDTMVTFADGQTAENAKYHSNVPWEMPNQQLGYVWEGNPEDIWEQLDAFNKSAVKSSAFGFTFNPEKVSNQEAALENVRAQYYDAFGTGSLDVDTALPEFRAALKAAGIDDVVAEKQAQLDEWLAENK